VANPEPARPAASPRPQIIVVTTAMLVFISYWRAAAIVLCDMASTVYYIGGIVEQAIGKAAPWYIGAVMLFAYAVRGVYIESCAMFVRGGVYRVVKEAMGGTMAKLSVSALMFDYVLTGPISGVSAGQYIAGLVNDLFGRIGIHVTVPYNGTAALFATLITVYFWWRNTRGLHESSDDALRIMQVTTVMVVILVAWCVLTLLARGGQLPPAPVPRNLRFSDDALGWFKGTRWPSFTAIAILVGFGHSILAMSGEESLAQVYREIEQPKVKNLERTGLVIFLYSLTFTSLVSFFAVALIPDSVRPKFYDNLISGLAMHLVGPLWLRLVFQAFVVVVGFLILAGAVNTSIVGSGGVLSRVSEDGVLPAWFRRPHRRFGTNYRIINLIAGLQLVTIVLSRGNVYVLGEAYAFGVVWSFAFKALAVLVLTTSRMRRSAKPHSRSRSTRAANSGAASVAATARPTHRHSSFLGFMAFHRVWFDNDRLAFTVGGGAINNPGRYLVLVPPINGASAFSGTPYFTAAPGDPYKAWDTQLTFDYMPSQFVTFRSEFNYRHSNVPYFAGEGGVTPPGGNTGAPGSIVPGWSPDLRRSENRVTFALLVKL